LEAIAHMLALQWQDFQNTNRDNSEDNAHMLAKVLDILLQYQ
jgi:hypothetical protein